MAFEIVLVAEDSSVLPALRLANALFGDAPEALDEETSDASLPFAALVEEPTERSAETLALPRAKNGKARTTFDSKLSASTRASGPCSVVASMLLLCGAAPLPP